MEPAGLRVYVVLVWATTHTRSRYEHSCPYKAAKKRDRLHVVPLNHANIFPTNVRFLENQKDREHVVQQRSFHGGDRRIPYPHWPFEGDQPEP